MEAIAVAKPRISYSQFVAQKVQPEEYASSIAGLLERRMTESRKPGARPIGPSQTYIMERLQKVHLGSIHHEKLRVMDFVDYCRERIAAGVKPQTVMCDITVLGSLLRHAKEVWELPDAGFLTFEKAKPQLMRAQLIGKSVPRKRRPTPAELDRILELAAKEDARPRNKILMVPVIRFSLTAARRISETCRIKRKDVDVAKRLCTIHDLKNPKGKGYHDTFPLLGEAWTIVEQRMAVTPEEPDARLFPFNPHSCSARYVAMKNELGIKDLRLHDNRRETCSRMFEAGFNVPEVQKVSLHRTPNILLGNYTSLNPEDLHKGPASRRAQA